MTVHFTVCGMNDDEIEAKARPIAAAFFPMADPAKVWINYTAHAVQDVSGSVLYYEANCWADPS